MSFSELSLRQDNMGNKRIIGHREGKRSEKAKDMVRCCVLVQVPRSVCSIPVPGSRVRASASTALCVCVCSLIGNDHSPLRL